jgi:hypothetical protein
MQHLGDPHAVLVIDETGFLKKGRHSAGVSGTWVTGDSVYAVADVVGGPTPGLCPGRLGQRVRVAGLAPAAGENRVGGPFRRRAGHVAVRARGPKGPGGMTGAGCPWPHPWSLAGGAGCWCGGV